MSANKSRPGQIIALGGHGISACDEDVALSRYILEQAAAERPRICFLSQGSSEDSLYIANFYRHFLAFDAQPSDLSLFQPHTADIADFLMEQDAIYVGGGNTKSMLALWREWGVDRILRQALDQGTVLSGVSAGAICWFEQGLTDSIPGELTSLDCLGFLPGSCAPHYDGETDRRPSFHRLIGKNGMKDGYGIDDKAGLHFIGGELWRVVASTAAAAAYRVEQLNTGVSETELDASTIVRLQECGGDQDIETDKRTDSQ